MDHAETVRRIYDLINAGDVEGFGMLMADDFVDHEELPGLAPTKDGVLAFFRMQLAAFPDMRMEVQDIVASGDKVVARVRYTGTNRGEFMGAPASGKSVDVHMDVGEGGALHAEEVHDALPRRRPGQLLVVDEVVGQQSAEPVDVSCVDQVIDASDCRLVVHRDLLGGERGEHTPRRSV
jgi:steroid delta-isomerase-like uncharacterized protein